MRDVLCAALFHLPAQFGIPFFLPSRLVGIQFLFRTVFPHGVFVAEKIRKHVDLHAVDGRVRGVVLVVERDAAHARIRCLVDTIAKGAADVEIEQQEVKGCFWICMPCWR